MYIKRRVGHIEHKKKENLKNKKKENVKFFTIYGFYIYIFLDKTIKGTTVRMTCGCIWGLIQPT